MPQLLRMILRRAASLLHPVRQLQKWNGWSDLYANTDTNGPRKNRSLGRNPGKNDDTVGGGYRRVLDDSDKELTSVPYRTDRSASLM